MAAPSETPFTLSGVTVDSETLKREAAKAKSNAAAAAAAGAIGSTPEPLRLFMSQQIVVAALLQPCLGLSLVVEEPHHIGEQGTLGIDPLGVGLEVQTADAQGTNLIGGVRIEPLRQPHARAAIS